VKTNEMKTYTFCVCMCKSVKLLCVDFHFISPFHSKHTHTLSLTKTSSICGVSFMLFIVLCSSTNYMLNNDDTIYDEIFCYLHFSLLLPNTTLSLSLSLSLFPNSLSSELFSLFLTHSLSISLFIIFTLVHK
jgi:hypothetical protein